MSIEKVHLHYEIRVIPHFNTLKQGENLLCKAAIDAKNRAYAPYSKFRVGAAVLLENGEIVTGSNQENATYPLGLCAERVAIFTATHQFPGVKIKKLALATDYQERKKGKTLSEGLPVFPCGSCRGVIREQEIRLNNPIELLIIASDGKTYIMDSVQTILPFVLEPSMLE